MRLDQLSFTRVLKTGPRPESSVGLPQINAAGRGDLPSAKRVITFSRNRRSRWPECAGDQKPRSTHEVRLNTHAATLPRVVSDIPDEEDPSGFWTYAPTGESLVDALVEATSVAAELRRSIAAWSTPAPRRERCERRRGPGEPRRSRSATRAARAARGPRASRAPPRRTCAGARPCRRG